jgi:hypothetical protein
MVIPKMIRYQATRSATTYRVMAGQTKVRIPAATAKMPATMNSHRQLCTRMATASWVKPPNSKATPASAATAARLPTR